MANMRTTALIGLVVATALRASENAPQRRDSSPPDNRNSTAYPVYPRTYRCHPVHWKTSNVLVWSTPKEDAVPADPQPPPGMRMVPATDRSDFNLRPRTAGDYQAKTRIWGSCDRRRAKTGTQSYRNGGDLPGLGIHHPQRRSSANLERPLWTIFAVRRAPCRRLRRHRRESAHSAKCEWTIEKQSQFQVRLRCVATIRVGAAVAIFF